VAIVPQTFSNNAVRRAESSASSSGVGVTTRSAIIGDTVSTAVSSVIGVVDGVIVAEGVVVATVVTVTVAVPVAAVVAVAVVVGKVDVATATIGADGGAQLAKITIIGHVSSKRRNFIMRRCVDCDTKGAAARYKCMGWEKPI
jgi:hypothetical protein